jgi:hypothetical protein
MGGCPTLKNTEMNMTPEQIEQWLDAAKALIDGETIEYHHITGQWIETDGISTKWPHRRKPKPAPWTLADHMRRFFPTWDEATMPLHRTDWTEDMLPEGWRPLLKGEIPKFGDQVWEFGKGPWGKYVTSEPRHSSHNHTRTMRPLSTPPRMVLEKIKAKCQANLALAKKRTQGNWTCVLSSATEATVRDEKALIVATANQFAESFGDKRDDANAAYIAACASDAEAGWRSTIAAIEWLQKERNATGLNASEWRLEQAILAAWK